MKQKAKLIKLLTRKCGATAVDIAIGLPSLCAHKRVSELKSDGWLITKKKDKSGLLRYFAKKHIV